MTGKSSVSPLKKAAEQAVIGALIMILLGVVAIFLPSVVNAHVSALLGWVLVVGGFAYFAYALAARSGGEVLWRMLISLFYVFAGFYLLASPQLELKPLTFLVAGIVFVESLLELVIFSQVRLLPGS